MITLTHEEAEAIHELIGILSGGNPENVFSWDGKDSMADPTTSACVKIYAAIGQKVPDNLDPGVMENDEEAE